MSVAERFASNLRAARKRAALSQEQVGLLASLHRTEISQLERALRVPRIDTLIKLAVVLEADPRELLAGISWSSGETRPGHFEESPG